MQEIVPVVWLISLIILGIFTLIGLPKSIKVFVMLRAVDSGIFSSDAAARWSNIDDSFAFWGYILSAKFKKLNDKELIKRCVNLRILFVIYTTLFIAIIVVFVIIAATTANPA